MKEKIDITSGALAWLFFFTILGTVGGEIVYYYFQQLIQPKSSA